MPLPRRTGLRTVLFSLWRSVVPSAFFAVLAALSGCSRSQPPKPTTVVVSDAALPAALAPAEEGRFVFGERLTGSIKRVMLDDPGQSSLVATVDTDGQQTDDRGLLGLAVDESGRVFASYTRRADHRLVVAQVGPEGTRIVWQGPETPERELGGHLIYLDGRLYVAVGGFGDPDRIADPDAPNGKVLQLVPDGPATQRPQVVSSGWSDPTFTLGPDRRFWIADRVANSDRGDRLALVVPGGEPIVTELGPIRASALVTLGSDRLGVCSSSRAKLVSVELRAGRAVRLGPPVAEGCSLGAARLPDGRVLISTDQEIQVFTP
ncbi:MAG: PQQ-dependent sugar dehydrogenase [Acidimicrobiales bacterium]|nr:PQQ-dependent sugar dehydrogenase [Acidimicrobiales bacterium]